MARIEMVRAIRPAAEAEVEEGSICQAPIPLGLAILTSEGKTGVKGKNFPLTLARASFAYPVWQCCPSDSGRVGFSRAPQIFDP